MFEQTFMNPFAAWQSSASPFTGQIGQQGAFGLGSQFGQGVGGISPFQGHPLAALYALAQQGGQLGQGFGQQVHPLQVLQALANQSGQQGGQFGQGIGGMNPQQMHPLMALQALSHPYAAQLLQQGVGGDLIRAIGMSGGPTIGGGFGSPQLGGIFSGAVGQGLGGMTPFQTNPIITQLAQQHPYAVAALLSGAQSGQAGQWGQQGFGFGTPYQVHPLQALQSLAGSQIGQTGQQSGQFGQGFGASPTNYWHPLLSLISQATQQTPFGQQGITGSSPFQTHPLAALQGLTNPYASQFGQQGFGSGFSGISPFQTNPLAALQALTNPFLASQLGAQGPFRS